MAAPEFPISTDRLILRPFVESDLDDLHRIRALPEVARFLYGEPWSRAQALEGLGRRLRGRTLEREGDDISIAVVLRDSEEFIGELHIVWLSAEHRRGEIGFVFDPAHHGRGYARESAVELLRLGFETFGLRRIIGRCDAANVASAKLMERLGMRREAHLVENEFFKGMWASEYVYAMLASEWPPPE